MNERIKELLNHVEKDVSGKWVRTDSLEALVECIIRDCIEIVEGTPRHCAYTTYDKGTVECTLTMVVDQIHKEYELKKVYKVIR